ncbi:MAG: hypothetical protein C0618_00395 [Desulfuromonas sp.]|nr:MAG: hypothetical protein C0618_00395 [Desulfuromonas sp.]
MKNIATTSESLAAGKALLAVLLVLLLPGAVCAVITGPCSGCHAMHFSQDGTILAEWGSGGPYGALLTDDCAGCHTGVNDGSAPYVNSTTAPIYNSSGSIGNIPAGGSFYWVNQAQGDARGHNVDILSTADATLSVPPGFEAGRDAADGSRVAGGNWPPGQQVSCSGLYGCHGTHSVADITAALGGGHHGSLSNDTVTNPGTVPYVGFRMLLGIAGKEDPDWEYTFSASDHNQYKGVDDPGGGSDSTTISTLCARCHGLFHSPINEMGTSSPWLRHPNDFDLGNSGGEYANYNGGSGYNNLIPLGSTNITTVLSSPTVTSAAGEAIITCLSCHRAHGSPYLDSLRWDYAAAYVPGLTDGFGGCAVCHSSKN